MATGFFLALNFYSFIYACFTEFIDLLSNFLTYITSTFSMYSLMLLLSVTINSSSFSSLPEYYVYYQVLLGNLILPFSCNFIECFQTFHVILNACDALYTSGILKTETPRLLWFPYVTGRSSIIKSSSV